jgi:monofunctional biosynthetic peptidoglycan transglycosylase
VVASEDQKFPEHWGFDVEAIEKAYELNQHSHRVRGASTISQQVAKNLYLWSGRSYFRKGLEAYFTLLIEGFWPKRRILEIYLNVAEFGDGTYGAEAASARFFHRPASRLSRSDAALLAAVLPNPERYSVAAPSHYVLQRREWILGQMQALGGPEMLSEIDAYPDRRR